MLKDTGLWSDVENLRSGLGEILRTAGLGTPARFPASRLQSRPEEYRLLIELPAITKDAVTMVYQDWQLTLSGRKASPVEENGPVERESREPKAYFNSYLAKTSISNSRIPGLILKYSKSTSLFPASAPMFISYPKLSRRTLGRKLKSLGFS